MATLALPKRRLFGGGRSRVRLGLDIGSSAIKALWAEVPKKGPARVRDYAVELLPDESPAALESALRRIVSKAPVRDADVRVAMAGQDIMTRYLTLPIMSDADLDGAIRYEGESYIPFPLSQVVLDKQIIEHIDEHKMRVLLVAGKRDSIAKRLTLVAECKLTPSIIDVDGFAVANAYLADRAEVADTTTALAHVGARHTNLVVLRHGQCCNFSRDLGFGTTDVAKAIEEQLSVKRAEANHLMQNMGEQSEAVTQAMQRSLELLISEVRLSFDFYETQSEDSITQLVLTGGGSLVTLVPAFVKEHIGVPTEVWSPTQWLSQKDSMTVPQDLAARLAVCVGLVVRD